MCKIDFITVDYIRFVVELSGITEFLEFAKEEQYYYVLNAAVNMGIVDELFPDSTVSYRKCINVLKRYKKFKRFQNGGSYKQYLSLKNINNLYYYIWPKEFEYIDEYISKEQLLRILKKYTSFRHLKIYYMNVYRYIFDILYPVPFDYNLLIQPLNAYIYMIENNMTEYPRSLVYKNYVTFEINKKEFHIFSSNKEANETKEGIEYMNNQRIKSCLKKYGVESVLSIKDVQEKRVKTIKERYGINNISQSEEIKLKKRETTHEHFGVDYPQQSKEVRNKTINRWLKTRGVTHISKDPEIKEQKKQTSLKTLGVENPSQCEKVKKKKRNTMHINDSFFKSKPEEYINETLISIFGENDIIRQFRSKRYPFNCDFYIKSLDMFIEYLGYWSHNDHAYNPDSEEDINMIKLWLLKSIDKPAYNNSIKTWTVRDPLKRKIAKENNLNWTELWNLEEFEQFINNLILILDEGIV